MISLGSERITLSSETETAAYNRATLTELFYLPIGCTELATAGEKVFFATGMVLLMVYSCVFTGALHRD